MLFLYLYLSDNHQNLIGFEHFDLLLQIMKMLLAINCNSMNHFDKEQLIINILKECYYIINYKFHS